MTKTLNNSVRSLVATTAIAALMLGVSVSFASAHGGGGQHKVDPAAPNCMGQLARLHANGKEPGNNPDTVKGFYSNQPHPGFGGPFETVQEQAKAFKAYCDADVE